MQTLQAEAVELVVAEDLARLNAVEATLWPMVVEGNGEALDRWLTVRRERERQLMPGSGRGQVGLQLPVPPSGGGMEVVARYVGDWREALSGQG